MKQRFMEYLHQTEQELVEILDWWTTNMVDETNGGFYGELSNDHQILTDALKGIVLNSRILWSFSAGYLYRQKERYKDIATRAYHYIIDHFIDREFEGVYWSVDAGGKMLDGKKQIYGLAFCIFGLAEYYKITKEEKVLHHAIALYNCIEKYSYDAKHGGYIEALSRNWQEADDLRLSEKDDNEKKSMNTHLHVIEAYANLYTVWNNDELKQKITDLLDNFDQHIINKNNYHLNLFFGETWHLRSSIISYGHDIEAAWLLQESAEIIHNPDYITKFKEHAIRLTKAAQEGIDEHDGGLIYEHEPTTHHYIREKYWWPQAEAMVGFLNAYQLTGDKSFFDHSMRSFQFIENNLKDGKNGEWFWGLDENEKLMNKEKAGFWKCPYHNSRSCIEVAKRLHKLINV